MPEEKRLQIRKMIQEHGWKVLHSYGFNVQKFTKLVANDAYKPLKAADFPDVKRHITFLHKHPVSGGFSESSTAKR